MRITVEEARPYWSHPSQHKDFDPATLPETGAEYWAQGPVCGMFHPSFWPGVWMAHYGVLPAYRGRLVEPAKAVLREFRDARNPERIIGWTDEKNRAALAFNRRLGFVVEGRMPLRNGAIIMQGWI